MKYAVNGKDLNSYSISAIIIRLLILKAQSSNVSFHWNVQPVPKKMRLEMVNEMQIEILNGGEILVNSRLNLNQNLDLKLFRETPWNSSPIKISLRLCTMRYREIRISRFWLVDSNLPTIQDFDLHFFHHFEFHLRGNGLYFPVGKGSLMTKTRDSTENNSQISCVPGSQLDFQGFQFAEDYQKKWKNMWAELCRYHRFYGTIDSMVRGY